MKIGMSLGMRGQRGLTQIQRAIAFLRSLGTSAHVWLPGANGVSVASLPSNNYLLSDGSTGYSTVDGVDGLTLDGMGALGSELVTNGDFNSGVVGWTAVAATFTYSAGRAILANNSASNAEAYQAITTVVGKTYKVSAYMELGVNAIVPRIAAMTASGGGVLAFVEALAGAGVYNFYFVATTTTTYIGLFTNSTNATTTDYYDNISVKEYTGIHLTQATTANKPLVRRGAYNLLLQNSDFTNAAWTKRGTCAVNATPVTGPTGAANGYTVTGLDTASNDIYQISSAPSAGPLTPAAWIKKVSTTGVFSIINASNSSRGTWNVDLSLLSTGWELVSGGHAAVTVVNAFSALGTDGFMLKGVSGTPLSINIAMAGLFAGTWTAAQILAEGGIPTTTATAASNPSAGKYWWSFDGSNDSLLSGNLGITNACTIVIAGRLNNLATNQVLFGETTNGIQIYVGTNGAINWAKTGVAAIATSSAGVIVAGVPFVITLRLSAGTAVIRNLGVQVTTAATALAFAAIAGARIGTAFDGTSFPTNGAIGWVVPLPTALSDADCLTVERLVGSQFPGMATF